MPTVYWLLLKDFCKFFLPIIFFLVHTSLHFFNILILNTKKNVLKTTSPGVLVPWVQSTVQWLESSLLQDSGYLQTSFCSSLTLASLLASLLAWRIPRKARTWAWTTYLFQSINFVDRNASCWHKKRENSFVLNFCCLMSWTRRRSPLAIFSYKFYTWLKKCVIY